MKNKIIAFLAGVLTTLLFVGVITYINNESSEAQEVPVRHEKLIKLLDSGAQDYIMNNYGVYEVYMPAYNNRTLQVITDDENQKENIYKYFEKEFDKAGILTYKVEVLVI